MLPMVSEGFDVLNISMNRSFTRLLSQIMATSFPPASLTALRLKLFSSNINFGSNSLTRDILHKNLSLTMPQLKMFNYISWEIWFI